MRVQPGRALAWYHPHTTSETVCPTGLRGWTQVPLAQAAWVQIPQLSFLNNAIRMRMRPCTLKPPAPVHMITFQCTRTHGCSSWSVSSLSTGAVCTKCSSVRMTVTIWSFLFGMGPDHSHNFRTYQLRYRHTEQLVS